MPEPAELKREIDDYRCKLQTDLIYGPLYELAFQCENTVSRSLRARARAAIEILITDYTLKCAKEYRDR